VKRFNLIFGLLFAGPGFLVLIAGLGMGYVKNRDLENRIRVEGIVIGSYANSVIEYPHPQTGERLTVTTSVSTSPPIYEVGEKVFVHVNPENPQDALIEGFMEQWFVPILIILFSLLFLGIGLVSLYFYWRAKAKENLKQTGIPVTGKVISVEEIRNLKINDENPWRIFVVVRNPLNGTELSIKSAPILDKPKLKPEDKITVYFDPQNPKNYYIDEAA
jgi:hypothetical protein